MVVYPLIAKRFGYFDDEFLKIKNGGNMILTVFYFLNFLDMECYN